MSKLSDELDEIQKGYGNELLEYGGLTIEDMPDNRTADSIRKRHNKRILNLINEARIEERESVLYVADKQLGLQAIIDDCNYRLRELKKGKE